MSECPFVLVDFECSFEPPAGSSLHVVGDHPALGCWNPAHSLALLPKGSLCATTSPVSLPCGSYEYKYILLSNGQLERWENFVGNRTLVAAGETLLIRDIFDSNVPAPHLHPHEQPEGTMLLPSTRSPSASPAVLVVSYILPLLISREGSDWKISWNEDAITAKKQSAALAPKRVMWIGCPGIEVSEAEQPSLLSALAAFSCVPVFLEEEQQNLFYKGFCRSFLWPTFHNVSKAQCFEQKMWRAYSSVNRKFADKVIEVYDSSDLVWVHDYHLLLLPSYILRKLRAARVGLFLHTPFPSSEIFRTISVRDELLRGMLNADLIGFHIFDFAMHFLTCCKRMLGLDFEFQEGGFLGVRDHKRNVLVQVSHAGVQPEVLATAQAARGESELLSHLCSLREAGVQLVVGIDEMDRLKGVVLKMIAFEQMLIQNSHLVSTVTFVQVGVRAINFTPAGQQHYEDLRTDVLETVERINKQFPRSIIFVELPTISMQDRMQLWELADVAAFTPIREGVNTFALEAVYSRREGEAGVLILSEFACCSRVLNGSLRVNPWDTQELVVAMVYALSEMQPKERLARRERNLHFVLNNTALVWAERFFLDLQSIRNEVKDEEATMLGFGLATFRRAGWDSTFRRLDITEVLTAYRRARRRAIFLDWGGTIVPLDTGLSSSLVDYFQSELPPATLHCLEELAQDPRNLLMVLSGQERSRMEAVFRDIPAASLAAEHGFFFKLGSFPGVRRAVGASWEMLVKDFDLVWMEVVLSIFEAYTARTNGASVQRKGSSLTWKYDEVDPEFGNMQAKELQDQLKAVLGNHPVQIMLGKGYLEVRPTGIDKGVMIDHIISLLHSNSGGVDFVLCIGDDSADECMFSALDARLGSTIGSGANRPAVFTAVVGQKPSAAHFFLSDSNEVLELCQSLRHHSTKANRNRSMGDLQRAERVWSVNGSVQLPPTPMLQRDRISLLNKFMGAR